MFRFHYKSGGGAFARKLDIVQKEDLKRMLNPAIDERHYYDGDRI
jgi:hypothetical protein